MEEIEFMTLEHQAEHDGLKRKAFLRSLKAKLHIRKEVTMGEENEVSKPTEIQEVLTKMIPLSSPKELPKGFSENCQNIWEAFNLGKKYERLIREKENQDAS